MKKKRSKLYQNYNRNYPNCNNCTATIVTQQFPRIRSCVGKILLPFLDRNKTALRSDSRIRKSLGKRLKLSFKQLLASGNVLSWIQITSTSFSDNEKIGVEGKGWSISDGYENFYLLNKNIIKMIVSSSLVLGKTRGLGILTPSHELTIFACNKVNLRDLADSLK